MPNLFRANVERCRAALASADVSDDWRELATSLLDQLASMNDDGRLSLPALMLATDSLAMVPGLENFVAELRATAVRDLEA